MQYLFNMSFTISGSIAMIKFTPIASTIIVGSLSSMQVLVPSTSPSTTPPSLSQITDSMPSTSITSSIS